MNLKVNDIELNTLNQIKSEIPHNHSHTLTERVAVAVCGRGVPRSMASTVKVCDVSGSLSNCNSAPGAILMTPVASSMTNQSTIDPPINL